jgi:hypothetical protein
MEWACTVESLEAAPPAGLAAAESDPLCSAGLRRYIALMPPSTLISAPVTSFDSSEAR